MGRSALARAPSPAELDVERAAAILAACKDVDSVKDVRDRAAAVQVWLRHQRASIQAQNDAAEIALRAERRLGELLMQQPKARGAAGIGPRKSAKERGSGSVPQSDAPTLADQGIDRKLAARAQKLAAVPERTFEAHVSGVRHRAEKLTTSGTIAATSHVEGYDSDEWYTPAEYIEAARAAMGGIDLDPASNERAQETVRASTWWSKGDDALRPGRRWAGRIWLNPPYSQPLVSQFVNRFLEEWLADETGERIRAGIVLLNASTDTSWWHDLARDAAAVCFTRGRLSFIGPDGKPALGNRVGQVFFCFARERATVAAFAGFFRDHGTVLHAGGLHG
jgi:phage N-6-adenine-methyltransferase